MAYTYDPGSVALIVGGKIITGYAEDSHITCERNEDNFMLYVGTDGFGSRAKSNNRSGRITINLQQTSPSNDDLQAFCTADELNNTGAVPVICRDGSGRTVISAASAWVVKPPSVEFGSNINERQWILETDYLVMNVGGN